MQFFVHISGSQRISYTMDFYHNSLLADRVCSFCLSHYNAGIKSNQSWKASTFNQFKTKLSLQLHFDPLTAIIYTIDFFNLCLIVIMILLFYSWNGQRNISILIIFMRFLIPISVLLFTLRDFTISRIQGWPWWCY